MCPWVAVDSCFILVRSHRHGLNPQSQCQCLSHCPQIVVVTLLCNPVTTCFHNKVIECRYWDKVSSSFSEGRLVYSFVDPVFCHMFFTKCQINTATQPLVSSFVTTRRTFRNKWGIVFNYAMKLLITRSSAWHLWLRQLQVSKFCCYTQCL